MIKISRHGRVTRFLMGREQDGQVLYWTAAYLIGGVLVDSGCAYTARELLEALRGRPVEVVVNTHHHEDHIGGNALLSRELGIPALASAETARLAASPGRLYPYQEIIWGYPEASRFGRLGEEVRAGGAKLRVAAAPGHSRDHVVFWEPGERLLFVGDAFISEEPKTARVDEDYAEALESLRAMAALGPQVMFSGLGMVKEDAGAVLEAVIGYLENMRSRIRELAATGLDPAGVVTELFGRESRLREMTQNQMSYANFVRAFMP